VWEGRCKASLIGTEPYPLSCMRYIELNPVRARMVTHPADYAWSGYRHNGEGKTDPAITGHPLYTQPGHNRESRSHACRELFTAHIAHELLHNRRHTANRELFPGTRTFKRQIGNMLSR